MMFRNFPHCCCRDSDVLFLIDSTGSNAGFPVDLLTCLRKRLGNKQNCRYAVADYKDFEDYKESPEDTDYRHWDLRQPFTSDRQAVLDALQKVKDEGGGGGDRPEQNLAALKKAAEEWTGALGGRGGDVKRVIVWHGDAPGWEHGEKIDGKGTEDDSDDEPFPYPTLDEAKSAVDAANVEIVALNAKGEGRGIDEAGETSGIEQASHLVKHDCLLLHDIRGLDDNDVECYCKLIHSRMCWIFLETLDRDNGGAES